MERRKVLVCFGDILGFGQWTQRAANAPEDCRDLIDNVYREFERFSKESLCHTKFLGDGIMAVQEINGGDRQKMAFDFFSNSYRMARKVHSIIQKHWPRPDGFRLRMASGYVWKRTPAEMPVSPLSRPPEYVGYAVNLAQRLLEIEPTTLCICHESIKETLGTRKKRIKFKKLSLPKEQPRGVDSTDLSALWSFSLGEKENS